VYINKSYDLDEYTSGRSDIFVPNFFVFPKNNSLFTVLKSPMAHKTYSQEQFCIQYYSLSLSFKPHNDSSVNNIFLSNVEFLIFIRHLNFVNFFLGTNLFFIKNFSIFLHAQDRGYFSLYQFLRNYYLLTPEKSNFVYKAAHTPAKPRSQYLRIRARRLPFI